MKYLISLILFIFPIYVNAQNIVDVCKMHVEKLGGVSNLNTIENINIEQTVYSNNTEIPQTTLIVPGKVFYQEINFPIGKNIICVVDGSGWMLNPYISTKANILSEKEAENYMINSNVYGPLYDYYINKEKSIVKEILLEGEKKIERDNCYKLKAVYKSGFVVYVYVSKKSFMIRKSENDLGAMTYSDYKKVNNVMFPFVIEITNKMGVITGEVIDLKVNIKINNEKFNKP